MCLTELSSTKVTKKHNVSLVTPAYSVLSKYIIYSSIQPHSYYTTNGNNNNTNIVIIIMPRNPIYVSAQSPQDIMSGLLEIMQSQSGNNRLTVPCMRAMNKYLATNLRQFTARLRSRHSKRSTCNHLCRLCGSKVANMSDDVLAHDPLDFEIPQGIDDVFRAPANSYHHEDSEKHMEIDDNSDENAVALTEVPSLGDESRIFVPRDIKYVPADSNNASVGEHDDTSFELRQTDDSGVQPQFGSVADNLSGPVAVPVTGDASNLNNGRLQGLRSVNQSFYAANDSETSIKETSQSPRGCDLQSESGSAVQMSRTAIDSSPNQKTKPSASRTRFGGPCNFTQSFCIFPESDSDASSEASSPSSSPSRKHGLESQSDLVPRAENGAGRTPFGDLRSINHAFHAPNESDPHRENTPEPQFGSSPPVMSEILCHQPIQKRPHAPPTFSFDHANSSRDSAEGETEGDSKQNTAGDMKKDMKKDDEKSDKAGYRPFLEFIKKSLNQPFNPDETLTETEPGTSSPSCLENEKEKGKVENTSFVSNKTEEDTEEDTDLEDWLIARGLIKPNSRRDVDQKTSFTETNSPSRPGRPYRNRPVYPPPNPNLPTIIITNTEIDSGMTVDYQNSVDHNFGLEFKRCRARAPKVDENLLTIPKPEFKPRSTLPSRKTRNSTSPAQKQMDPHDRTNGSQPNQATTQQREENVQGNGPLRHLTRYPIAGDKRKGEEDHWANRPGKKVHFAFGTDEDDLWLNQWRSPPQEQRRLNDRRSQLRPLQATAQQPEDRARRSGSSRNLIMENHFAPDAKKDHLTPDANEDILDPDDKEDNLAPNTQEDILAPGTNEDNPNQD